MKGSKFVKYIKSNEITVDAFTLSNKQTINYTVGK